MPLHDGRHVPKYPAGAERHGFFFFSRSDFHFGRSGGERLLLLARRITTPSPPHGSWEAVAGGTARRGGARLWAETHGFFFCSKLFLWATVELLGLAGWWLGGARVEGWLCPLRLYAASSILTPIRFSLDLGNQSHRQRWNSLWLTAWHGTMHGCRFCQDIHAAVKVHCESAQPPCAALRAATLGWAGTLSPLPP
eukprot:COSAG02_NODE_5516_length_4266_cov_11.146148_2_plen_195_part_00